VSQLYYKGTLNCFNLSVYSLGDKRATCFMWNETEGKRGASEIATCLRMYLSSLPSIIKQMTLFSDECAGYNRNQYVACALLHAVAHSKHIDVIEQKFLETGHTEMEVDKIHSAVEIAQKRTHIYIPSQWNMIVWVARRKNPCTVVPLKYEDFIDTKQLKDQCITGILVDDKGQNVQWRKLWYLQLRKNDSSTLYFKYHFDETEFQTARMKYSRRGRKTNIFYSEKLHLCTTQNWTSRNQRNQICCLCADLALFQTSTIATSKAVFFSCSQR